MLPDAPIVYAADTAGLPYGDKGEAEITARVAGMLGRMTERFAPRLACIACNTASTIALGMARDVLDLPIVGTVPAIKPAAAMTETGTIGLLGTAATIRQPYVDQLEADHAVGKTLLRHAAPELVELAEAKMCGERVSVDDVLDAAKGLVLQPCGADIDVVVLACTHFPLLTAELAEALGKHIAFIDGAEGIARRVADLTKGQTFRRVGDDRFIVTGPLDRVANLAPALARYGLGPPERL
ncbi:Glutamate racemase [Alteripontixanthobacter maritimus]|uniref:Glutamate racemase n=1 Tax=Alteripontixanthobacter maritimus TaxID=2161824 RepID=A0A369Q569_9SPHN|nr:Glutamate racemase [Alteripontixanthobacter maritimus]